MMSTAEQIARWLSEPEGERLEFKSARTSYPFEKLVDYCVALANEGGGVVLLGATDERPRQVVGTAAFAEPGRTEAGLYQRLRHRIPIEEATYQDKRLLIVHVPSRLPGTAWEHDGRYLRRAGDDLVAIPASELHLMFAEAGPDYSAQVSNATIVDLAPEAMQIFRERWARKTSNPRILDWSNDELLVNAELQTDGKLAVAALVLFGTRKGLGQHLAQAEIVFEYRSSEAAGPAQDRVELREGFLLSHDRLWERINLRNDRQSYQDGLFRYDIATFDEVAVREALLNAVAHRDYRLGGSVFVRQYARRLEVVSPGGFPAGITADNILDQQNPRNRRLSEALARCGLIERSGQGLNLMVESAVRQSKALPDFSGSSHHEVRLTLSGVVQDPAFVRFLERVGEDRLRSFSTHDFLTLDSLRRHAPLAPLLSARLPALVEAGVIEQYGRGRGVRYLLSRGLFAAIGRRGSYTRERGLDHETNKELLLKHIRENDADGSPLADLKQVLPALSVSQVQGLLHELRDEGRIRVEGVRRWARWHLPSDKAQARSPAS
ncbi:MAG: putative DNA binding domain-containing protein [Rhodanobacteraceae bacterium]|nr:putative DNA binding domain-containing protein [Rhodanobacteraceae bacterium]